MLVFDGVFQRHPKLRGVVVELGCGWVPELLVRLDWTHKAWSRSEPLLAELKTPPSQQIIEHMAVTPYPFEDVGDIIRRSDPRLYMFASDYPHTEGSKTPMERFDKFLEGHAAVDDRRLLLRQFRAPVRAGAGTRNAGGGVDREASSPLAGRPRSPCRLLARRLGSRRRCRASGQSILRYMEDRDRPGRPVVERARSLRPQMNSEFQNTPIVFAIGKSTGPAIVTCKAPVYAIDIVRPRALFEGHLRDPATEAAALGFSGQEITRMNLSCTDDARDVSLDFPMVDDNTILLGLDNMIYTLKRQ